MASSGNSWVLDTHNPDRLLSISTVGTYDLRIYKNSFFLYYHFNNSSLIKTPFKSWLGTITMRDIEYRLN